MTSARPQGYDPTFAIRGLAVDFALVVTGFQMVSVAMPISFPTYARKVLGLVRGMGKAISRLAPTDSKFPTFAIRGLAVDFVLVVTGFRTGSGQTGFSQKGNRFHTYCCILF